MPKAYQTGSGHRPVSRRASKLYSAAVGLAVAIGSVPLAWPDLLLALDLRALRFELLVPVGEPPAAGHAGEQGDHRETAVIGVQRVDELRERRGEREEIHWWQGPPEDEAAT